MAYAEILPGRETILNEDEDEPPLKFHMSTRHIDFLSSQRSPQWLDEETVSISVTTLLILKDEKFL